MGTGSRTSKRTPVAAAGAAMLAAGLAGLAALFVNVGILRAAGDASGPGRLMVGPVVQQVSEAGVSPAPDPDPDPALQPFPTPQVQPAGGWSTEPTGSGPSLTGGGPEPEGEPIPSGIEHSFRSGGDD
jgi:hypothetical protein